MGLRIGTRGTHAMASAELGTVLQQIRRMVSKQNGESLTDIQLLDGFRAHQDQTAFAVLVKRHGPMVLRVCRHVLHHHQDAEDAFQATFLVLARKATAIRKKTALASWLHGVAYRMAMNAKRSAARRRKHEREGGTLSPAATASNYSALPGRAGESMAPQFSRDPAWELGWSEVQAVLDEEIERLPEKYRAVFVLCCLEGIGRAEAGRQLGLKEGTVSSRLDQARKRLQQRLARRGVTLSSVLAAAAITQNAGAAAVTPLLVNGTVRAAQLLAAGEAGAAGAISANVVRLVEGAGRAMMMAKLRIATALLLAAGALAGGVGLAAHQVLAVKPVEGNQESAKPAEGAQHVPVAEKQTRTDRYGDPLPEGAVARLGTDRWRHPNGVTDIVFSHDSKTVISSGGQDDGIIHFWEADTGRQSLRIDTGDYTVAALAVSPDGKKLASASHSLDPEKMGRVTLWNLATGKRILQIERPGWRPRAVAFAPEGNSLATAAEDGSLQLWGARTGKEHLRIPAHQKTAYSVLFSPDGKTLVSTGADETIRLWDSVSGRELRKVEMGTYKTLIRVAISPDGKTLAGIAFWYPPGGGVEKHVVLWDVGTGKKRLHYQLKGEGYADAAVAFSPDGRMLAVAAGDGTIILRDLIADQERLRIRGVDKQVWVLAFSPNGKRLAGRVFDSAISVWDVATGRELANLTEAHRSAVSLIAFTANGNTLATASDDATIRLWDVATGRQRFKLGHDYWVRAIALSPDGKTIASSGLDDTVRLWDVVTGKQLQRLPGHGKSGGYRSLAFSVDGKNLASWGDDWQLRVWEVDTGKEILNRQPRLTGVPEFPSNADQINRDMELGRRSLWYRTALTEDGKRLVVVSPQLTHVVDVATAQEFFNFPGQFTMGALAISPDGRLLAQGTQAKDGLLIEVATGKEVLRVPGLGEGSTIAFSHHGKWLAGCSGWNGPTIGVWDIRTGQRLLTLKGPAPVRSLAFSPNDKTLAAGLSDTTALIWDLSALPSKQKTVQVDVAKYLQELWSDLAHGNPNQAYTAMWSLAATPEQAVDYLEKRLQADPGVDPKRLQKLIADLNSEEFSVREAASREMERLGGEVQPALRRALDRKPSPEVRRRLEVLLALPPGRIWSPDILRGLRAIQALEHMANPKAQELLKSLARGAPEARLTQEAKASLDRLAKRAAGKP